MTPPSALKAPRTFRRCLAVAMPLAWFAWGGTPGGNVPVAAQMDLRQASGVPLPASDIPSGTVSVRVVRDSFANNLSGVEVVFDIGGRTTTIGTDANGRAEVKGIPRGTTVQASAVVDGARLQTQPVTIGDSGIRFVLVALGGGSAAGSAPAGAPPAAPPAVGSGAAPLAGGGQGMDLRQASGVPLPASDLPSGTISVRVVRDSFANNLEGVDVTFTVDGKPTVVKTGTGGRAQIAGVTRGARVIAAATVGSEQLRTQEVTVGDGGVRFVLVATGAGAGAAPAAAAVPGHVVLGQESRIVAEYSDERLNIYYAIQIVNGASTPVDTGGPLVFELPAEARGASIIDGTTAQATATGAHVTVPGPFAPGTTDVNIAYELPYSGPTAHLQQRWPAEAQQFAVFGLKTGNLDIASPQLIGKQSSVQQGQPLVMALLPALPEGQAVTLDITGLPHHATWPRSLALGAAGVITLVGLWAAFVPTRRRRA